MDTLLNKQRDSGALDPILLAMLTSSAFSAINLFWKDITDEHERYFHRRLIDRILETPST